MKVIDSSVSLKWFIDEPRRDEARALLESDNELMAPDFSYAEVANVMWRKVRAGDASIEQAEAAINTLPSLLRLSSVSRDVMVAALRLAARLNHSVYDCIFLAMVVDRDAAVLVTDDEKFAEKAVAAGYGDKVRKLADQPLRIATQAVGGDE